MQLVRPRTPAAPTTARSKSSALSATAACTPDDAFDQQYVVHGEGEYADGDVHVNTCETHASLARRWLSPHRDIFKDKLTLYLRGLQLRQRVRRKPGDEALKLILKTGL
jgi:transposase